MHIKDGYVLRRVGEVGLIVPTERKDGEHTYALNRSGMVLWSMMKEDTDPTSLVQKMTKRYEVPLEVLEKDINVFLRQMKKIGLLEE